MANSVGKSSAKSSGQSGTKSGGSEAHPAVVEAVRVLQSRNQNVSFAESCTGGLLSAIFTRLPGVSSVFEGSIVGYAYPVKESLLDVPAPLLRTLGAVSIPVARAMAHGVRKRLNTDWGISITGIAGPGGGTEQKPVGTVCFGLVGPGVDECVQRKFSGSRRQVQMKSAVFALRLLLRHLGAEALGESKVSARNGAASKKSAKKS